MPPPNSNTSSGETTMPLDDSSEINSEVRFSSPKTSILGTDPNLEFIALNPQEVRRYFLCDRKEPNRLGFSKSSSNVVYPISDFVSYHRLSSTHMTFTLKLSSALIPSYFQEASEDPKWKYAMVDEKKAFQLYVGDG